MCQEFYNICTYKSIMKLIIGQDGLVNGTPLFTDYDCTTQQYVRTAIHTTLEELGVEIDEEWEMDDDSIEITIK